MKKFVYFLFALSLLILFISVLLIFLRDLTVVELPVEVHVNGSLGFGFDLNDSKLNFGNLLPGSSSTRYFSITSPYDFPTYAEITVDGDISSLLRFDDLTSFLPRETRKIGITVLIDEDARMEDYSGVVLVHFRRVYVEEFYQDK